MNLDELATNVARDIGAVRQRSCKRADGVEYHFEQSELEQFAKELIAEYEKTVNSELYPRPDPRVAELEAKLQQMNSLCEFNERTMSDIASKYEALEAQNSALLVAIEAKDAALEKIACIGNGDSHGNSIGNCMAIEALALSPSTELLEARDRKRDTKLLRIIEQRIHPQDSYQDDYFKSKVHSYNIVNELIKQRESGEWKPELGD